MRLIATIPARNEGWVIGLSVRAALMWCDAIVVLDHASTDDTAEQLRAIAEEHHPSRMKILHDPLPEWSEMDHRQLMLDEARAMGATHIAIVDADEVLTSNLHHQIVMKFRDLPIGSCLQIPMHNLYRSINIVPMDGSVWGNAMTTIGFADHPSLCWTTSDGYHHHHREPLGSRITYRYFRETFPNGGVMHLQFVSERRLRAKHALYQMDEVLRWPNRRSRYEIAHEYSNAPSWVCRTWQDAPENWWMTHRDKCLLDQFHPDREPWQEAEVRRLLELHGVEKFDGLNLFGLAECSQAH